MLTDAQRWYLQKISPEQRVMIRPYDPEIETVVSHLNAEIHSVVPSLVIRHMGAAALKISGQNDIDLYIFCRQGQFGQYLPKLTKQLGAPTLQKSEHLEWAKRLAGFEVTIYLTDPTSEPMQEQIQLFDLLSNDAALRDEYQSLKISMDGQSLRAYQQKKYEFYNRVLGKVDQPATR